MKNTIFRIPNTELDSLSLLQNTVRAEVKKICLSSVTREPLLDTQVMNDYLAACLFKVKQILTSCSADVVIQDGYAMLSDDLAEVAARYGGYEKLFGLALGLKEHLSAVADGLLLKALQDKDEIALRIAADICILVGDQVKIAKMLPHLLAAGISLNFYTFRPVAECLPLESNNLKVITKRILAQGHTASSIRSVSHAIPGIDKRVALINEKIASFAAQRNIPYRCKGPGFMSSIITMAGELMRYRYDLVIGVCKGGVPVPLIMQLLGRKDPIAFIHCERGSDIKSSWIQQAPDLSQARRVLICEDDIDTGATLQKLRQDIFPHISCDVAVYSGITPSSQYTRDAWAKKLLEIGYGDLLDPTRFPATHFLQTLQRLEITLKALD